MEAAIRRRTCPTCTDKDDAPDASHSSDKGGRDGGRGHPAGAAAGAGANRGAAGGGAKGKGLPKRYLDEEQRRAHVSDYLVCCCLVQVGLAAMLGASLTPPLKQPLTVLYPPPNLCYPPPPQALYQAALVADQNLKLSIFATRPAINAPLFNLLTETMGTAALILIALLIELQVRGHPFTD